MNRVTLIGFCGRPPEVRYTNSGLVVADISVATSSNRKNKQTGDLEQETEWHRVVAFGKTAEYATRTLTKGTQVVIDGKLKTESYERNGQKVYKTQVVASSVKACVHEEKQPQRSQGQGNYQQQNQNQGQQQRSQQQSYQQNQNQQQSSGYQSQSQQNYDDLDDEIPF